MNITLDQSIIPGVDDFISVADHQKFYTDNIKDIVNNPEKYKRGKAWTHMPWAIAYRIRMKNDQNKLLRYFLCAILLKWTELIDQLKRTCGTLKVTKSDIELVFTQVWQPNLNTIVKNYNTAKSDEQLLEKVEKHTKLNQKLFKGNKLKSEVKDKINEIVNLFMQNLAEDQITFNLKDVVLIGSNASYNYTKDSDVDIHLIADVNTLKCPENLYTKIYSAYRSLFNKNFDIDFYGIPVELYVETGEVPTVSNGIYSVISDSWIKKPIIQNIPEIDESKLKDSLDIWIKRYNKILEKPSVEDIENYIDDVYLLRKEGLTEEGEYGIKNLTFKELRNLGHLDELKELKNEVISQDLSLESLRTPVVESLSQEIASDYKKLSRLYGIDLNKLVYGPDGFMKTKYPNGFPDFIGDVIYSEKYWEELINWLEDDKGISLYKSNKLDDFDPTIFEMLSSSNHAKLVQALMQLANGLQPIIRSNDTFEFNNVPANDADVLLNKLLKSNLIKTAHKTPGRFNFSKFSLPGQLPERYYTIQGELSI